MQQISNFIIDINNFNEIKNLLLPYVIEGTIDEWIECLQNGDKFDFLDPPQLKLNKNFSFELQKKLREIHQSLIRITIGNHSTMIPVHIATHLKKMLR